MLQKFVDELIENGLSSILLVNDNNREEVLKELRTIFEDDQFLTYAQAEEIIDSEGFTDLEEILDKPDSLIYLMEVKNNADIKIIDLVTDTMGLLEENDLVFGLIIDKKYEELFKNLVIPGNVFTSSQS